MNINQYHQHHQHRGQVHPSLAFLLVLCVVLVTGFILTADSLRHSLPQASVKPLVAQPLVAQPPAHEANHPPRLAAKPLDSIGADSNPALNEVDVAGVIEATTSFAGEGNNKETAVAAAQSLLEAQRGVGGVGGEETACRPGNSAEACNAYLELVPPSPSYVTDGKTVLLLGVDSRSGGLISLTDTIMLLFLDEEAQRISLLSIPRDLYVMIPGHGRDRINTAVVHGASGEDLDAGIATLKQTIESTLNVEIDHHVLVDFQAVIRSVDALGGIDVYVPYTIDDPTFPDMYGGFDPLFIPAGQHHFTGEMALKYARTRHQDNDFYRAQRQQQILLAIRQQAFNLGVTQLLESAPTLYRQVRHGVFTDLNLVELIQLGYTMSQVPLDDIQTAVLDGEYVSSTYTEAGENVLILKPVAGTSLIEAIFTN